MKDSMEENGEPLPGIPPENLQALEVSAAAPELEEKSVWTFQGRIGRGSFWSRMLLLWGIGIVVALVGGALEEAAESVAPLAVLAVVLYLAWLVFAVWMSLAIQVKRWHDMNHSGLAVLWNFTIIALPIVFVLLGFVRGTEGPNKYGSDPLRHGVTLGPTS